MIYELAPVLVYKVPSYKSFRADYLYYCEVVLEDFRYKVQLNSYQYALAESEEALIFLVSKDWLFGLKIYCISY